MKLALAALALAAVASGCDRSHGVVLWHAYQGAEAQALSASVARWNAAHPETPVELVGVPYNSFGDKLTSAMRFEFGGHHEKKEK